MIYLDNAATSNNKPLAVRQAVMEALKNPVNIGRNSGKESFVYAEKVLSVREKIAELLQVETAENIAFTQNASFALNFAVKGFCKKGIHVITTPFEHNSVLRQLFSDNGPDITILPCDEHHMVDFSNLKDFISENTKLLIVNVASNVTGTVLDYKKIYQVVNPLGIAVLFDFSQAIGNIDVNLHSFTKCMAAFSGHKSLLGPQGTGVLYVSPDLELNSVFEGGTGSLSNELKQPDFLPDQFEIGTLNTPGILGLGEGVRFVLEETPEKLLLHKKRFIRYLYHTLSDMPGITVYHDGDFEHSLGILSFNIGDLYSERVADILSREYGISTRGGFHCAPLMHKELGTDLQGTVRISPGYRTNKQEIDWLITAINRIRKNTL